MMIADGEDTILRRKAAVGQKEHAARAMSLQKALRVSLAKVADRQFDLALSAIGITQARVEGDTLGTLIEDDPLMILLDGPEGARGAVLLDAGLVTGMIQQQTMGTVTADRGTPPRPMTHTDAAMCAPLLDAVLAMAAPLPQDAAEQAILQGFRFGARAETPRLLLMALEAPQYHVYRLTIDIAGGQRQGKLVLILPNPDDADAQVQPPASRDGETPAPAPPAHTLSDTLMQVETDLMVSLTRLRLPLSEVGALEKDQLIKLPKATFDRAMVATCDGRVLNKGTLGQVDGMRALRLDMVRPAVKPPQRRRSDRRATDQPIVLPLPGAEDAALDALPQMGELPDMSDVVEGQLAGADLSDVAEGPELSDRSDLPSLDLPGGEAMPDMSDLDLPNLPDLDLPDLDLPDLDLPDLAAIKST